MTGQAQGWSHRGGDDRHGEQHDEHDDPSGGPAGPTGRPGGQQPAHDDPKAVYPRGVAASSHALGPYLYRVDELVLTAPSPQEFEAELDRLRALLGQAGLQRRLLWDLLVYRLFLTEYPPHPRTGRPVLAAVLATLRLLLVALLHGLRVPVEVSAGGSEGGAGDARVLRVTSLPGVPDLVPVLVERLRSLAVHRGTRRPGVLPHHVLWASAHPMPYSAAPPTPTDEQLPALPERGWTGEPVVVAVVDSGVDTTLPWFAAADLVDPLTPGDLPEAVTGHGLLPTFAGHGTFVAGTVLDEALHARQPVGRPVRILSVRATGADGFLTDATAAAAVDRVRALVGDGGPSVLLLAWGGYTHDGAGLPLVERAVRRLAGLPGAPVVVAAAGNDGQDSRLIYPACLKDVVAVTATVADGSAEPADFSNRGSWVDACTDGVDLVGPFPQVVDVRPTDVVDHPVSDTPVSFDGWAIWSGTSMSAARVAGAVARVVATAGEPLTGREAWDRLRKASGAPIDSLGVHVRTGTA
jgi:subtilisin family serine protease